MPIVLLSKPYELQSYQNTNPIKATLKKKKYIIFPMTIDV